MGYNEELSLPDSRGYVDTKGLSDGLRSLFARAEDCADYHDILNQAIHSLYQHVSEKGGDYGDMVYGDMESGRGQISLSNKGNENGILTIDHSPSKKITREFSYLSAELGEVNLRERMYSISYNGGYPYYLTQDTRKVMDILGFEHVENVRVV